MIRRGRVSRITATAVASLVAIGLAAGPAWAYYRAVVSGSKTATASATSAPDMTVTITGNSVAKLYPGGPAGSLTFSVKNNSTSQALAVTAVQSLTGAPAAGSTCTTPDISLVAPTSGLPLSVPAGQTVSTTLSGIVKMGTAATSNCQGQAITLTMKLTGKF